MFVLVCAFGCVCVCVSLCVCVVYGSGRSCLAVGFVCGLFPQLHSESDALSHRVKQYPSGSTHRPLSVALCRMLFDVYVCSGTEDPGGGSQGSVNGVIAIEEQ